MEPPNGIRRDGAGGSGARQEELGRGGALTAMSSSKSVWARGTAAEARAARQMDGICYSRY